MHRIIWPHIGEEVGLNIGDDSEPFVPVLLNSADERLFGVQLDGVAAYFAMNWVSGVAAGKFDVGDHRVSLLIELTRPGNMHGLIRGIRK